MKATTRGGVKIVFTGNGAEICSAKKANQTAIVFKVVDRDTIDTGNPGYHLFYSEDESGLVTYENAQSTHHWFIQAISLANKTKDVVNSVFGPIIQWYNNNIGTRDLPRNGDEPSLKPFSCACSADTSFLQKVTSQGGACKSKQHFCIYCEFDGLSKDLFSYIIRSRICEICKHNSRQNARIVSSMI